MLLSRVAEHLYWAARYLERAEGTARVVRSFTETIVDLPKSVTTTWEPLLAIPGSRDEYDLLHSDTTERSIVHFLVADHDYPGSVAASISQCRDNLRSCREIIPRPAWLVINDLHLSMGARAEEIARRSRARFLDRVLADAQRFEGIVASMMPRDEAFEFLRIGQVIERADMTTRVVGVRASALATDREVAYLDVQWMGILRSLSAMQAFQRMSRSPMDSASALRFLIHDRSFPRSVGWCVEQLLSAVSRLPMPDAVTGAVAELEQVVASFDEHSIDFDELNATMDEIQAALVGVHQAISAAYLHASSVSLPGSNNVGAGRDA
jgi:uncharacterized alpha-E superfamily protein